MARHLLAYDKSVITQKLIQTGVTTLIADDIIKHRTLMNMPLMDVDTDGTTCPLIFVKPASPHLSARLENHTINLDDITHATARLNARFDIVPPEGAGGVLMPIADTVLTLDYIAMQSYPVIVVTSTRLGSINHTLLTLEAMQAWGLTLWSVVLNHHFDTNPDISTDTQDYLKVMLHNTIQMRCLWSLSVMRLWALMMWQTGLMRSIIPLMPHPKANLHKAS